MKLEIVKNMGLRWTLYRTQYELKKKFGYLEKAYRPIDVENSKVITQLSKERISLELKENLSELNNTQNITNEDKISLIMRADRICDDEFLYFSNEWHKFKSWHYSPKMKKSAPSNKHWSKISDFNNEFGDIKWIWELSRFTFAYDLSRAYIYTLNDKYVEKFWERFENFIKHNPFELGVNYKCSQEMSFRINAWIFALYHVVDSPSSSEERVQRMMKYIYFYSEHIFKHLNFSVEAVKNNHSISESTTLVVIGNTFPHLPNSKKIYKKGLKYLSREVSWQIKKDGSFIQHSHNYHRLVLQNMSWYAASAISKNQAILNVIKEKGNASIEYFLNMITSDGRIPNYGMNDGSYIFPLTERKYSDYRPVLQALNYQLNSTLLYDDNLGINEMMHLFSSDTDGVTAKETRFDVQQNFYSNFGGYHKISYGDIKVYVKSKTYKERPAQADMNHVEIWEKDKCLFGDAGTYSYNDNQEILNYFNGTSSHNTVLINKSNQMEKGNRFIWYKWSKSKKPLITKWDDGVSIEIELLNYGNYRHKRIVSINKEKIEINDQVINPKKENVEICLQWLTEMDVNKLTNKDLYLTGTTWTMNIHSQYTGNIKIYRGDNKNYRGWVSDTYGEKHDANQITYNINTTDEVVMLTTTLSKQS